MIDPNLISMIRKSMPSFLAEQITSVQPMNLVGPAIKELLENSKSVEELKNDGYRPVSKLGLMWIKD